MTVIAGTQAAWQYSFGFAAGADVINYRYSFGFAAGAAVVASMGTVSQPRFAITPASGQRRAGIVC
jgi:hypothetical protein